MQLAAFWGGSVEAYTLFYYLILKYIIISLFCTESELPVAEDRTVCLKVCGTQPSMASHRYLDIFFFPNVNNQNKWH